MIMKKVIAIIALLGTLTFVFYGCSTNSSNYSLYNKDGSLNMKFVKDMNDYFEKHPEKLPK